MWLVETVTNGDFRFLGRIIETFEGSDGVIRSTKIRKKDGYYKSPAAKLAPVLPSCDDVFTKETGSVILELSLGNNKVALEVKTQCRFETELIKLPRTITITVF